MSFLLTHGIDPRRESRQIAAGLIGLAVIGLLLLNLGIYQGAETRLVHEGWDRLASTADLLRDQLREQIQGFERAALHIAGAPALDSQAASLQAGTLDPEDRLRFQLELERATADFHMRTIRVVDSRGQVLLTVGDPAAQDLAEDLAVAQRAAASQAPVLGDIHVEKDGSQSLLAAVVLRGEGASVRPPVMLFETNAADALLPLLGRWPGIGRSAHGYLVRRDDKDVIYLTEPGARSGVRAGQRAALQNRGTLAAAMAATGVESSVEVEDGVGRRIWSVTRYLPEVGWGLVGQADRGEMMAQMRGTLFGLLLFDLAMALCALSAVWFWRRQYATGLARREVEITRLHASRVQAIFDTAFDAILTFDREFKVRTVNRAAAELIGRSSAEMDGQPLHRFVHWNEAGKPGLNELPAHGSVCLGEAMRADGSVVPVEFSLGRAGEGDELLYTAIVRDISERVDAEARIRSFAEGLELSNRRLEEVNAQLEEASRLKSEFLANTSHELRTPLNGMIGFLQLVLDGMCENPEEERDFLRQALQCSRHLLGLINDVLDIAKIEAGKLNLEIEKIDVGALFDEVYTVTHVQAAQKGIELKFEPPAEDTERVRGDFGKVKQVLINLIGNSLKFTPRGSITVRALPHIDLGHFMFEVVDTGIGIPKDRQKLIFEKFTQGDGSTTRKYGGTGLGLAISRSLVELMGGIIGVQSDGVGKGSRMYFSLPVWRDEEPVTPAPDEAALETIQGPAGGPVVLVVEDDPTFRKWISAVLHQRGYRTVEAQHAEAGWVLVRRLRPAVVVLDFALSCGEGANLRSGWDLAERMTTDPKTRHIPLIFVTGFEQEVRDKLKATAFARRPEHLVKPIDGAALVSKIDEMVGSVTGRVIRVLMADDDPSVSAYIRKVLPEDRFHLEIANNGEECLHILRTQPNGFDLLLLDLMMPEVSGYDVLREMTLAGTGAEMPVLVLTNFPEPRNEEEKRLLEQGLVLDVLPKTAVHDNPQLLAHVVDWHMQVAGEIPGLEGVSDADSNPQREAA